MPLLEMMRGAKTAPSVVALVTGGSRGLGFHIAKALGEFGAALVLTARKQDELDATVAQLRPEGHRGVRTRR